MGLLREEEEAAARDAPEGRKREDAVLKASGVTGERRARQALGRHSPQPCL